MPESIENELKWVAELDDIDHDICEIARRAIKEIDRLKEKCKEKK